MNTDINPIHRTFEVRMDQALKLSRLVTELNKRAVKLGLPEIKFDIVGESRWVKVRPARQDEGFFAIWDGVQVLPDLIDIEVIHVSVEGEAPHVGGWTFLAKLSHVESGNVVHTHPDLQLPEKWLTADAHCEHCGLNRDRRVTYVLRHVETGEEKQVGKSCLKDFTGHPDPESLASFYENAWDIFSAAERGLEDEDLREYVRTQAGVAPETVMAYVVREVRLEGRYLRHGVTVHAALAEMFASSDSRERPTDEDRETAKGVLEWARGLDPRPGNEYEHNIKVLAGMSRWNNRQFFIGGSMIAAYRTRDLRRKEERKPSEFLGEVKKKLTATITVKAFIGLPQYCYGAVAPTLVIMEDDAGNVLTWKASAELDGFVRFRRYVITGTVKDHTVYRDVKQTVLTRCKYTPAPEPVSVDDSPDASDEVPDGCEEPVLAEA